MYLIIDRVSSCRTEYTSKGKITKFDNFTFNKIPNIKEDAKCLLLLIVTKIKNSKGRENASADSLNTNGHV
jgi:hypothetical protein